MSESIQLPLLTQSQSRSVDSMSTSSAHRRRQQARSAERRNTRESNGPTSGGQRPMVSWTRDRNADGKSSLDLIVDWLTVQGNYDLWRSGRVSKQDVSERIVTYLVNNGAAQREWRGVEQQILTLERNFRKALAFQNQTGQGIMDEAELERARQDEADLNMSDIEDHVENAQNEIEVKIQKKCKYFYELEPIMKDRPSSRPLDLHELRRGDNTGLEEALNVGGTQNHQSTPSDWSNSGREGNDRPNDNMHIDENDEGIRPNQSQNPAPAGSTGTLPQGLESSSGRVQSATGNLASPTPQPLQLESRTQPQSQSQSQRRLNYAERITDWIFPTREEMMAQSNAQLSLNRERLHSDMRMVQTNIELAAAFCQGMQADADNQERMALQLQQLHLDIEHRQLQITREQATLCQMEEQLTGLFARARMV
ncbi:hypothetical protein PTTG_02241 [Puccinia triticina 1-1 BBBD Race 1]|uniref:Uncharacterized protein n=1 Tax=Puccinia triticina (isolate 1-1 / race 1 (BBBD)) TaxID=630390 RepID=A0A180GI65_PUCT1|nr:hypothetical protein PTTG_02241 [Puccinia triticina 1-1 BBBD Race 1]